MQRVKDSREEKPIEMRTCETCKHKNYCKNVNERSSYLDSLNIGLNGIITQSPDWVLMSYHHFIVSCNDYETGREFHKCRECYYCKLDPEHKKRGQYDRDRYICQATGCHVSGLAYVCDKAKFC